jgi:acetyltransferase
MVRMSNAYELILGSSLDPQFGPVLLFGAGGQLVETFRDRALGLPPLNSTLARRLMEQTRIYRALGGVRGRAPVDLAQLEQVLVRFSQLIVEQPRIKEIDINPLLVSADTIIAVDGRVVLHDGSVSDARLPRPAIRPYPSIDVNKITARDGSSLTLRPIRPEDEPAMARFHETLSDRSVYLRYFHRVPLDQRVAHERLIRACFVDYDRETVLVAETPAGEIVAAGRLTKTHGTSAHGTSAQGKTGAVFALLVSDRWQEQGLGTELLRALITIARREKISRLTGPMTIDNVAMREICKWLGFEIESSPERGVAEASLVLDRESLG